ncbi:hypothetical protein JXI42_02475 [bacterium]|nr:hypothetical protein [bacterium]
MKRNNISYLLIILIILGGLILAGCRELRIESLWNNNDIIIDGNYNDWEDVQARFLEDEKIVIGFQNDAENLYCMVRFTDLDLLWKIQNLGATIWINKEDEKKENGICYIGSENYTEDVIFEEVVMKNIPDKRQSPMDNFLSKYNQELPDYGNILVLENILKTEFPEDRETGYSASSKNHNGVFCYEYRIPLPNGVEKVDKIALGLETGGFNHENSGAIGEKRNGMGRMGGGMPGGGLGMGGGSGMAGSPGMGPGGGDRGQPPDGTNNRENRRKRLEKQEIWFKISLASNK